LWVARFVTTPVAAPGAYATGLSGIIGAGARAVRIALSNHARRAVSDLALAVEMSSGWSLSLERRTGGLHVCVRAEPRHEQCCTAVGVWPDEDEVIEEGTRQNRLAGRMYGEARAAARVLAVDQIRSRARCPERKMNGGPPA
jgi:hypothetical protein